MLKVTEKEIINLHGQQDYVEVNNPAGNIVHFPGGVPCDEND
jgi:hypothetical protein